MKILTILNDLDIGGAQNYTINLLNTFAMLGNNVILITLSHKLSLLERLSDKVKHKNMPRRYKIDLKILMQIRKEIEYGSYDGIISSYPVYQKLAMCFIKRKPIFLYPVHSTVENSLKSYVFKYILFKLRHQNEIYITSIENQTQYLSKTYRLKKGYFKQIYNGIDEKKFTLPPETFNKKNFLSTWDINSDFKIILMVAGFRKEKRHIDAIRAFTILQKKCKNVFLICVGDNRVYERDSLQEFINKQGIKNIKLVLAPDAGDIKNFYWSANLFTLTSNKVETFPISSLEAMACGVPCVLTDTGGASNILTTSYLGLTAPIENPEAIAKAWETVLMQKRYQNKQRIRSLVVSKYSIKESASHYLKLLSGRSC